MTAKTLAQALFNVQGAINGVVRDAKNPHFKNRYATLEAVIEAIKPALQANRLVFTQMPGSIVNGAIEITTRICHVDTDQEMHSTMHVPLSKMDAQGVGSAITYGSRYSLMAILGLPPIDDDAEAAVGRTHAPAVVTTPSQPSATYKMLEGSLKMAATTHDLDKWKSDNEGPLQMLDEGEWGDIQAEYKAKRAELMKRKAA